MEEKLINLSEFGLSDEELFTKVDHNMLESEKITAPRYSYWKSVFRVFFKKKINIIILLFFLAVAFYHRLEMVQKFVRAGDEFLAFGRERYAAIGAVEYGDADFLFEIVDGRCQGWLGDEQSFGRLVERADIGDPDGVSQLL